MRGPAAALAVVLWLAACGGAAPAVDQALRHRLEERDLSVSSIACVDSGLRYEDADVFRCNVNFGDPHIVPYCAR